MSHIPTLPIDRCRVFEQRAAKSLERMLKPLVEATAPILARQSALKAKYQAQELDEDEVQEFMDQHPMLTGIGAAMIIVADNLQYEFLKLLSEQVSPKVFGKDDKLRNALLTAGPSFPGTTQPWADAIRHAANYVRHASEWVATLKVKASAAQDPEAFIQQATTDLSFYCKEMTGGPSYAMTALVGIGLSQDTLLNKWIKEYYDVASHFRLNEPTFAGVQFQEWVRDAIKMLRSSPWNLL